MRALQTSIGSELPAELGPTRLAISPDGAYVGIGGSGALHILEAASLRLLHSWSNGDSLRELVFDRTGRILVACTPETMFAIDVETGREIGSADFDDWMNTNTTRICITADASNSRAVISVSDDPESDQLLLLKLTSHEFCLEGRVTIPDGPGRPVISLDGRDIYVVTQDTGVMNRVSSHELGLEAQSNLPAYPSEIGVLLSDSGLNIFASDTREGTICSIGVPDLKRAWTTAIPDEALGDSWDGVTIDSQLQFGPDQSLIYFGYIGRQYQEDEEEHDEDSDAYRWHAPRFGIASVDSATGDIHRIVELEDHLDPMNAQLLTCPRLGEIYLHAAGAVRAYDARTLEVIAQTPDFERVTQATSGKTEFSGRAVVDDARSRLLILDGNKMRILQLRADSITEFTETAAPSGRRIMLELPE